MNDWMPKSYESLHQRANQTADYLTEDTQMRMGLNLTAWLGTEFIPKLNALNIAYTAWKNPATRTPVIIAGLQDAVITFVSVYRKLYSGFLRSNPLVTDPDLIAMGLPKHPAGRHTQLSEPDTEPIAETRTPSPGVVELHYRDSAHETSRRKPAGIHGVEIRWAVLDTLPQDWKELVNSSFDTATPFRFSFDGKDRGRRLYFALRWENMRGNKGPWSVIGSAIIP